jgi:hypothetical protein
MKIVYTFLEDATINNKMSDNFKKFYMTNTFKEYHDKTVAETENRNINIEVDSNNEILERLKERFKEIDK